MHQTQSNNAVHVEFTADGFVSTGISYDDYSGMNLTRSKYAAARRYEAPLWAMNDKLLREVLIRYMEKRARIGTTSQSDTQRLLRAQTVQASHRKALMDVLTGMCKEYADVNKAGGDPQHLKSLAIRIGNIDTQLRFLGNEHTKAIGVVYFYYRLRYTSAETAFALDLKAPHVRAILWRLDRAAEQIEKRTPVNVGGSTRKKCGPKLTRESRVETIEERRARWRAGAAAAREKLRQKTIS
jgi:hypothetical protein